jgi:hypothetical protein
MWRPRDRERYIGSYDPEHEMPDPDRAPGDRWQSDAYRDHFRDSRYAYRMNPDRFENRFEGRRDVDRDMQMRWNRDGRDREYASSYDRGWDRGGYGESGFNGGDGGYDRSFERAGYGRDYGFGGRGRTEWGQGSSWSLDPRMSHPMDRDWDRGPQYDRDRIYGSDRGWDRHDDRDRGFYGDDWRRRR